MIISTENIIRNFSLRLLLRSLEVWKYVHIGIQWKLRRCVIMTDRVRAIENVDAQLELDENNNITTICSSPNVSVFI